MFNNKIPLLVLRLQQYLLLNTNPNRHVFIGVELVKQTAKPSITCLLCCSQVRKDFKHLKRKIQVLVKLTLHRMVYGTPNNQVTQIHGRTRETLLYIYACVCVYVQAICIQQINKRTDDGEGIKCNYVGYPYYLHVLTSL